MAAVFGFTLDLSTGAQPISGDGDGVSEVVIRANVPGIFIGGSNVADNLPSTGYELVQNREYRFQVLLPFFVAALSPPVSDAISVFVEPKV